MKKRAALARAIALDPELVFLDEPTTGLDPKSASEMDELILYLKEISKGNSWINGGFSNSRSRYTMASY
ncbi:hypothetical protein [Coxiella-like endosymbiont of Rhipicephalus sanguineus]|uniref:hypothetical protein n=1 Tax=Coxiella-like endosymbiont of Rhipicephalus sanguineus TaxID=1955402 RepID=UPI00203A7FBF|nr:hypothetical protein [Coxiella-like endosymbiont of Rhipicephalus sanguineus]